MKWTSLNDVRETYLSFFESKGHIRIPSFPLVPKDDNSLLLINSGMAPMKKYFTGEVTPPYKRVTTCQKCIRNNDIENVGKTLRHLTYFEMLGNFSFGDYFKETAIHWAWEFFTEVLEIPKEKLFISVYQEDDEAYDIWTGKVGIDPSRMVRLGKEDNFWEHGAGPCGPSSEIYFDYGEDLSCGETDCTVGCDCNRYVEIGNIVFTQFESDGRGNYTPLEKPNIDFGMGLERLACVMQDIGDLFKLDTIQSIIHKVEAIAGVKFGVSEKDDISMKIIADHIRSITFMIGDGVMPSNEGRGYIIRRLLRRAGRYGKLLGIKRTFLHEVSQAVIEENREVYPAIFEKQGTIQKIIQNEEEGFSKTIDQGMEMLNAFIDHLEQGFLSGDRAFLLNDTYGFPLDLTKEILAEKNIQVDEARFKELMREQRERARSARVDAGADAWKGQESAADQLEPTIFTGYSEMKTETKILGIIQEQTLVDTASVGDEVILVLRETPFYAEGGGQASDSGKITSNTATALIVGVKKTDTEVYTHRAVIEEGSFQTGDNVTVRVHQKRREATMRNHTAAHLLQAALRTVIGEHVEQAGQLVDSERMRFDFTHFSALSKEEIEELESQINSEILESIPVQMREMPIEEARELGAMALFGEKYGDMVRVVSIPNISKEFCGGTHVDVTSKLGLFKIISETSVASGVRRIEAVTGFQVLNLIENYTAVLRQTAAKLKVGNFGDLASKVQQVMLDLHDKENLIDGMYAKIAELNIGELFAHAKQVGEVRVIQAFLSGVDANTLRAMCDKVKNQEFPMVAVLGGSTDGKIQLAAASNRQAQEIGVEAGELVKRVAALAGGKGGGRPDFAMAGVKDKDKISDAIEQVGTILEELIREK